MKLTVAMLQLVSCGMDGQANLAKGDAYCRQAAAAGADIDFGYSISARVMCDVLSYHFFAVSKGALYLTPWSNPPQPLVIRGCTKAAINVQRSTTEVNDARHPYLIDRIPWTYTSVGVPLWTDSERVRTKGSLSRLHLRLAITGIAGDGTVTLATGRRRVLLKPGGEVKTETGLTFLVIFNGFVEFGCGLRMKIVSHLRYFRRIFAKTSLPRSNSTSPCPIWESLRSASSTQS
jgi:hypothetical protein